MTTYVNDGDLATPSNFNAWLNEASGEIFNVKASAYGAVGDGTTDDTTAIQNALDALQNDGGTVVFPPGNYLISSALEIPTRANYTAGVRRDIIGMGDATITQNTNNTQIFRIESPADFFSIQNLSFDYTNAQASTNTNSNCIEYYPTVAPDPVGVGQFQLKNLRFVKGFRGFAPSAAHIAAAGGLPVWGYDIEGIYSLNLTGAALYLSVSGDNSSSVRCLIKDVIIFAPSASEAGIFLYQASVAEINGVEFLNYPSGYSLPVMIVAGSNGNIDIRNLRIETGGPLAPNLRGLLEFSGTEAYYNVENLEISNLEVNPTTETYLVRVFGCVVTLRNVRFTGSTELNVSTGSFYIMHPESNGRVQYDGYFGLKGSGNIYMHKETHTKGVVLPKTFEVVRWSSNITNDTDQYIGDPIRVGRPGHLVHSSVSITDVVTEDWFVEARKNGSAFAKPGNLTGGSTSHDRAMTPHRWGAASSSSNSFAWGDEIQPYLNKTGSATSLPVTLQVEYVLDYTEGIDD